MRAYLSISQFIITLCLMQQALAAPILLASEVTYPIQGSNINDIVKIINSDGPLADGKRFSAITEARVSWTVDYKSENNKCAITNIQVTDTYKYIFPAWVNYPHETPVMQQTWNNAINKLKQHEYKHGNNSVQAAYEVENMLHGLAAMDNCDDLKQIASTNTDAIIQKYKNIDIDYDNATQHGVKQG